MFCPQCKTEYREGFHECADCRVALVAELPPEPEVDHSLNLVTVLTTQDTVALRLAEAALEEAGIEYLVSSDEPLRGLSRGGFGLDPDSIPYQTCRIQVSPEHEADARAILDPLENPEPIEEQ